MTLLIAYFSWKGHTEKTATALAKLPGAELVRIEPAGTIGIGWQALKAFAGMKSAIRRTKSDLTGIDTLVIASPVRAGRVPPYVSEYPDPVTGGAGKPFHVLIGMGGRGDTTAIAIVRKALENKGMIFGPSATTIEKDVDAGNFTVALEAFAPGIRK